MKLRSLSASILKATSVLTGVKALSLVCSVVRNKLIAWLIGPVGFGLVILYNSALDMIGTITRLSIDQSATRDVAGNSSERHAGVIAAVVRSWSLWLGLLGMAVTCALSPALSVWMFDSTEHWMVFCLLSVVPLATAIALGRTAIMTGLNRFAALSKASVFSSLSAIAISVWLIWWLRIDSIVPVIIVYAVTLMAGALIYSPDIGKVRLPLRQIIEQGKPFIKLGFMMTVSTFVAQLFNYLFVIYLNCTASTATVGLYQGGYTLINTYIGVIFTGIWTEYFPRLSRAAHSRRSTSAVVSHELYIALCVLCPIVLLFISADRWIIELLYAPDFFNVLPYVSIGIAGIVVRAFSWCVAFVIVARGDGKIYIVLESVDAVIGFGLNILGWHLAGMAGLGVAFISWYTIYSVMVMTVYRRHYRLKMPSRLVWMTMGIVAIAFVALGLKIYVGAWVPLVMTAIAAPLCVRALMRR